MVSKIYIPIILSNSNAQFWKLVNKLINYLVNINNFERGNLILIW